MSAREVACATDDRVLRVALDATAVPDADEAGADV